LKILKGKDHLGNKGTDKIIILQRVLGRTNCLLSFDRWTAHIVKKLGWIYRYTDSKAIS
jgi:hypothetical protein